MKLLVLACLIALAISEHNVVINCGVCSDGSGDCLYYQGGGFNGYKEKVQGGCNFGGYPQYYDFECQRSCNGDCLLIYSDAFAQNGVSSCTETQQGRFYLGTLDVAYSKKRGDFSLRSTRNWCSGTCGLSGGAIAGIVIASVVLLLLICLCAYCCCCRNRQQSHVQY